ncbi:uncharacterized protein LOC126997033 [Eriocheir sinensis]|uniref:uncharacterized protein LOC126997033 n=1 Tax=Eriocheir sinensis TaxID=95602 RepID=UPI0021CABFC4|nr:uncharacterized protein LOC126997033 [Eriocheir sinensis]
MAESGPAPPSTSPKTLKCLVVYRLARLLLESSVPAHLRKYLPVCNLHLTQSQGQEGSGDHSRGCQYCEGPPLGTDLNSGDNCTVFDDSETVFDDIIIAEAGERNEHLLKTKGNLLNQLHGVKQWWDDEGWFGKQDAKVRREVREACSDLLQPHLALCKCPLMLLTLELMFCTRAGCGKMVVPLSSHMCSTLSKFLDELQPFGIERLYTFSLQFGSPSVIVTLCRCSPLIKWIHLKIEFAKGDILSAIGLAAPNIETVVVIVREYELYLEISSTVEIVIGGGEDLEDNLYRGFFKGSTKGDIDLKIRNGEEVTLSFPKLKYIDVGSHRDVREFLHHLLYFYPDTRSITCDSESWVLSKYSFAFPVVTPSSLGNGPVSLQDKVTTYSLQDMSFSSFCLTSRLPDIIGRYKKLEHVSLHLLKGPWKINTTCEMAKQLLCSIKCQYLTICVDVYMSSEDLISLYMPSLKAIGHTLRILQFHLTNEVNVRALCQLINMCEVLEELSIVSSCERCEVAESDEGEPDFHINKLPKLKCLSVSSRYNVTSTLYQLTQYILHAAPCLGTLELEMGGRGAAKWILDVATAGNFTRLKILHLYLPGFLFDRQVVSSFFPSLISVLPGLSCLMVGGVCHCDMQALRAKYRWTKLKVVARDSPYVAFRTLSSRCC